MISRNFDKTHTLALHELRDKGRGERSAFQDRDILQRLPSTNYEKDDHRKLDSTIYNHLTNSLLDGLNSRTGREK